VVVVVDVVDVEVVEVLVVEVDVLVVDVVDVDVELVVGVVVVVGGSVVVVTATVGCAAGIDGGPSDSAVELHAPAMTARITMIARARRSATPRTVPPRAPLETACGGMCAVARGQHELTANND